MKNVLRIFKRDVIRLLKAPAALVVVLVLIALPSLYAWFNIIGFWNPYENTDNLRVCVVNEDKGANTDMTGELDLGDQIVDELHSNTQLGWVFTDRETAMQEVGSGKAYAAFIIPDDFSYDFTTLGTEDFQHPQLEYFVNEKAGAVSPKITDTGATTLDESINSMFVSAASGIITDTIDNKLTNSKNDIDASQASVSTQLEKAKNDIDDARSSIARLGDATNDAAMKTADVKTRLQQAKGKIALLSGQLADVSAQTLVVQNKLGTFSSSLISSMDRGSTLASQAAAKTNAIVGKEAGTIASANGDVNAAIENGLAAADENDAIIAQLKTIEQTMPDGDEKTVMNQTIANMQTQNDALKASLIDLQKTSQDTSAAATNIAAASDSVNTALQGALSGADEYRTIISSSTLPSINNGISQIGSTTARLSAATSNQALLVDQAMLVLDQLSSTLGGASTALVQTDALLVSLQDSLGTVQTDLAALGASDTIYQVFGEESIDAGKIADFMLSPTQVRTESLYPLNAYGSAMAPLFTNLTLWIGVFMLMVILRQEVDDEGIKGLTLAQRYWGRWLFLAPIAALQAIVCCAGNLVIGVQVVSVPLYFVTAVVASLTYLSIQYALSVTLQHIGKGICVILVFAQIPGATGLYPIEMTPAFFQVVYPLMPFTYGINAMRETIAGFYGSTWAQLMFGLLVFLGISFVLGLLVRPYLTNLNRLFAKQIKESDILNGEEVNVPLRRYRLGQLIRALSDREEYRIRLRDHAERFLVHYPRLKRGAWVFGIAVPTVATLVFHFSGSQKVVVLTAWLVWLIAVLMFLVVIEHIRDSFERQLSLDSLSDEELRSLFSARSRLDGAFETDVEGMQEGRRQ